MPGLSLSELFTWKSEDEADNIVLVSGKWILKRENFKNGEFSMPNDNHTLISAQFMRMEAMEWRYDLKAFYERERVTACVSGLTSLFALGAARGFFKFGLWEYLLSAPPAFLIPYGLSWLYQNDITARVLLGHGLLCPLCCIFRGGFGLMFTSAVASISLSTALTYGATYMSGIDRGLPAPNNFKGLTQLGRKILRYNRAPFVALTAGNFIFGAYFAYLQVNGFATLHKEDVRKAHLIEFEKQRRLE